MSRLIPLCALLTCVVQPIHAQTARGRVVDVETRLPVAGAVIRDVANNRSAISDASGQWALELGGDSSMVEIEHIGFAKTKRVIRAGSNAVVTLRVSATELDALVVSASRRLQKLKDAPVPIELITREEIAQTGSSDVASVLLERTGIELEGGHPAGSGAMLQGFDAERVLILLDGQPMVGRMSGSFDLGRIPVQMLQRVEVVKGPQSTLFGSDALGGVINLVTREAADGFNAAADIKSGTQDRLDAAVQLQAVRGRASLQADLGRRQVAVTPGIPHDAGARNQQWDAFVKAGLQWNQSARIQASALVVDESQRWQTGQLYNFANNMQIAGRVNAEVVAQAHTFTPTFALSEYRHTPSRSSTPEIVVEGETETQRLREAELLHSFKAGAVIFDNGVEVRREDLVSANITGGSRSLDGVDAFSQLSWTLGKLAVVPGIRYSTSAAWGTHWTPRVALMYRPAETVTLRASAGSAFRAPAFKELYMSFLNAGASQSYVVRGNENLRPESSRNISVGAEVSNSRHYARVQLFHNQFDDFIETFLVGDSAEFAVYSYENVANGTTRGLEVEANTSWKAARFEAGYSYLDTQDDATNEPLLGRPQHSARLATTYTFGFGTRIGVTGIFTGSTPVQRVDDETLHRDAYTRFDARISHSLPRGIELSAGVNNLTDARPTLWPGYTQRHIYIGAAWRLNPGVL